MLRHCLAPSLRRQLHELPTSLDETYERVLKEIQSTNQGRHARRLLHCLAVAIRPLRVEELAEVLAFDPDVVEGETPRFRPEWRWEDQEKAVLSACSSLITIVDGEDSRVVQFSHFSVKEFLVSDRLATAGGDVSRYYIVPESANLILAQACLAVLLNLDNHVNEEIDLGSDKDVPLLGYAAEHWISHARVGNVLSYLSDAMDILFDINKPYFLAWKQIHSVDGNHRHLSSWLVIEPNPLYCAALCGFYDLVQRLIIKFPEQVNQRVGALRSPLVAALSRNHFHVAELLVEHGAHINVRRDLPLCHAIRFSDDTRVKAVRFLLRHGAHVNAGPNDGSPVKLENWLPDAIAEAKHRPPLHVAADMGCSEVARMLLEHGADVDRRDGNGWVPLHLVSASTTRKPSKDDTKRYILAQLLVERTADLDTKDLDGATPLHFASYHGQPAIVKLLLDHGASPLTENSQGQNPLHELPRGNYDTRSYFSYYSLSEARLQDILSVAQLLLGHGVDVNAQDTDHATALHFASSYGSLEIAQLLLDHGARADAKNVPGQTPLHLVSQSRDYYNMENPNVARLLLEFGVDVNAQDKDQATPLHFACSHENVETALVLLDHGAEVNARNADGQNPLHRVVAKTPQFHSFNAAGLVQLLVERGADVNARDKDQATPLHFASYGSMSEVVQILLDHGAKADARNADGQTPLHRVSQSWSHRQFYGPTIVRELLKHSADVNARDKNQATPLHLASYYGYDDVATALLDHGAWAYAEDIRGQTPLHRASQCSDRHAYYNSRVARILLKCGLNVNARDRDEATPLHLASYYGNASVAEVLLDHGARADVEDVRGQTPLHRVSQSSHHRMHDDSRLARQLLERGVDANARDQDQATPLHLASYSGDANVAELLLDHGALVNAKDIRGQTPLHQVLLGNHEYQQGSSVRPWSRQDHPGRVVCLAQRLLERGADANARNNCQETPLHLASRLRLHEVARILIRHGADINVRDSEGKSPLQLASGRKGRAMKRLLSSQVT